MRCWLLFHRELEPDAPEAYEVLRFQEVAKKIGIDLQVLQPRHFDLLVDSTDNWSTMYQDKKLDKPDLIIPRTGSETSYFRRSWAKFRSTWTWWNASWDSPWSSRR
jgi:gamma-F420-2:alpha-L-glutamate ligase